MPSKAEKIAALLDSPVEGERAAAHAAWERINAGATKEPVRGSPEWVAGLISHKLKIGVLSNNRSSPVFSREDVKEIRNLAFFGSTPWDRSAPRVDVLLRKLERNETETARRDDAPIPLKEQ